MAKRKFTLSAAEIAELKRTLAAAGSDPAYDRLRAILDYASGVRWDEIAARYRCSRSKLTQWCHNYRRFGKQALMGPGRRRSPDSRLTRQQRADLARRLAASTPAEALPGQEVSSGDHWTAKDLFKVIRQWYGVVYHSPTTYYALLRQLLPAAAPDRPDDEAA